MPNTEVQRYQISGMNRFLPTADHQSITVTACSVRCLYEYHEDGLHHFCYRNAFTANDDPIEKVIYVVPLELGTGCTISLDYTSSGTAAHFDGTFDVIDDTFYNMDFFYDPAPYFTKHVFELKWQSKVGLTSAHPHLSFPVISSLPAIRIVSSLSGDFWSNISSMGRDVLPLPLTASIDDTPFTGYVQTEMGKQTAFYLSPTTYTPSEEHIVTGQFMPITNGDGDPIGYIPSIILNGVDYCADFKLSNGTQYVGSGWDILMPTQATTVPDYFYNDGTLIVPVTIDGDRIATELTNYFVTTKHKGQLFANASNGIAFNTSSMTANFVSTDSTPVGMSSVSALHAESISGYFVNSEWVGDMPQDPKITAAFVFEVTGQEGTIEFGITDEDEGVDYQLKSINVDLREPTDWFVCKYNLFGMPNKTTGKTAISAVLKPDTDMDIYFGSQNDTADEQNQILHVAAGQSVSYRVVNGYIDNMGTAFLTEGTATFIITYNDSSVDSYKLHIVSGLVEDARIELPKADYAAYEDASFRIRMKLNSQLLANFTQAYCEYNNNNWGMPILVAPSVSGTPDNLAVKDYIHQDEYHNPAYILVGLNKTNSVVVRKGRAELTFKNEMEAPDQKLDMGATYPHYDFVAEGNDEYDLTLTARGTTNMQAMPGSEGPCNQTFGVYLSDPTSGTWQTYGLKDRYLKIFMPLYIGENTTPRIMPATVITPAIDKSVASQTDLYNGKTLFSVPFASVNPSWSSSEEGLEKEQIILTLTGGAKFPELSEMEQGIAVTVTLSKDKTTLTGDTDNYYYNNISWPSERSSNLELITSIIGSGTLTFSKKLVSSGEIFELAQFDVHGVSPTPPKNEITLLYENWFNGSFPTNAYDRLQFLIDHYGWEMLHHQDPEAERFFHDLMKGM